MFGHPALRLLIRMKLKGAVRQQRRRLKRPSSWIFAVMGLVLMLGWLSSVLFTGALRSEVEIPHDSALLGVEIAIFVLSMMTVFGSFNHRGLYLPKEEIELVFSAPLARTDLVRYRLIVNILRSVIAGLIFGVGAARRLHSGVFAFTGVLVTMLTLPLLGQALSLFLGDAENRLGKLAKRLPLRLITGVLGVVVGLGVAALFFQDNPFRELLAKSGLARISFEGLTESPIVQALLLPTRPWASMIAARDAGTFLTWFLVCAVVWWAAFELTARIPIDFRELSLATSADVAQRLRRLRRGGIGAGVTQVSKETLAWRVPWIFGRGSFGSIAWLKSTAILRKARGTLLVSALIVAFLTLLSTFVLRGSSIGEVLGGAAIIAVLGTVYLCSGLRFDFRNDLEQMELVKAFPVRPSLVFLATILPEVSLVALLLALAVFVRACITGAFDPLLLAIVVLQPLVTLGWVAIDNVVFLFAPVRYTPGQEGALQHTGRSVLLTLLRFTALLVALGAALGPAALTFWAGRELLELSTSLCFALAGVVLWCGLALVDVVLVLAGGAMLRRFDVARDRG
jgi:hypothetical protein